jgi:uncharacterized protein with NRDE domain
MCLIAFAIGTDPGRPLLLASNRDEFFDRPTQPLHRWTLPDGTGVIAGRDLREGGTWLGVSEAGRVAMVTNVRSADPGSGPRSRGELTTRWLSSSTDWKGLLAGIAPDDYGGFNLVVGDLNTGDWAWITNRDPERPHARQAPVLHHQQLVPGIYGLSNASLNTPWSKTLRLTSALALSLTEDDPPPTLIRALADNSASPSNDWPHTGVPAEIERALSSAFVDMGERGYGTRSSLVMQVLSGGGGWRADLREWTHLAPQAGPHRWTPEPPRRLCLP